MTKKFEFPQELVLGAIKSNYSFMNGINVKGEDYAVFVDDAKNLMVIKNKALQSETAKKIASSMVKGDASQEHITNQLAKLASYKQILNSKNLEEGREL